MRRFTGFSDRVIVDPFPAVGYRSGQMNEHELTREDFIMRTVLILFSVVFMAMAGWGDEITETTSLPLESYLPDQAGYRWNYWGFAEYGHWMQLDEITRAEGGTVYRVSGMVDDMSEGEGGGDLSISLKYLVTDSAITVVQRSPLAMDNDFQEMELLRLPLETGSSWTQVAINKDGEQVELFCEIEEMEENLITVRYSRTDSPFYQLRIFEEGIGVVTFETLYMSPDDNFEIGFTLFRGDY